MNDEHDEAAEREGLWRQLQVNRAGLVSNIKTTTKQRYMATRSYSDLIDPIIDRIRLSRGETGDDLEALMPQIRAQASGEMKKWGGPAVVNVEAEEKVFASYASKLGP